MIPIYKTKQYRQLWHAKSENRLPHALMLAGVKGTHKNAFADYFSRALMCQQVNPATGEPCDKCHSCRLVIGRAHSDVSWLQPEKEGGSIKVEQIRGITEFIQQTSFEGGCRIVLISPADAMNTNAANALLKTLEEPSGGAYLILINDQASRLPATIVSRCQKIAFQQPDKVTRFALAADDVVRTKTFKAFTVALDVGSDRIKLVADLSKNDSLVILDYILSFLSDLLKTQLDVSAENVFNQDFVETFLKLKTRTSISKNAQLMTYVQQQRSAICHGINFNKQLLLESIIARWGR